jgi:hypothetical protein
VPVNGKLNAGARRTVDDGARECQHLLANLKHSRRDQKSKRTDSAHLDVSLGQLGWCVATLLNVSRHHGVHGEGFRETRKTRGKKPL